jgi:hypothetical protein
MHRVQGGTESRLERYSTCIATRMWLSGKKMEMAVAPPVAPAMAWTSESYVNTFASPSDIAEGFAMVISNPYCSYRV